MIVHNSDFSRHFVGEHFVRELDLTSKGSARWKNSNCARHGRILFLKEIEIIQIYFFETTTHSRFQMIRYDEKCSQADIHSLKNSNSNISSFFQLSPYFRVESRFHFAVDSEQFEYNFLHCKIQFFLKEKQIEKTVCVCARVSFYFDVTLAMK